MKRYIAIAGCILFPLVISGCENALTGNHDGGTVLASIRAAIYDPVTSCAVEKTHTHDGVQYSGHYNNDGHGHHSLRADNLCAAAGCADTGVHQHNGIYYAGHAGGDERGHHGGGHG